MGKDEKGDEAGEARVARFTVRPKCGGAILGFNHGLLREGVVYEVAEFLGELVLREVGPSPLGFPCEESIRRFGFSNGNSADHLFTVAGGRLGLTVDECQRSQDRRVERERQWRPSAQGEEVRIEVDDERGWGEWVEGDVYRANNEMFCGVRVDVPDNHPQASLNGRFVRLRPGMLFKAQVLRNGHVRPLLIVGHVDDVPKKTEGLP